MDAVDGPHKVDVHAQADLLQGLVAQVLDDNAGAGVIDQHIQPVILLLQQVPHPDPVLGPGDIGGDTLYAQLGGSLLHPGLAAAGDDHLRPLLGHLFRNGPAKAAGAAGYKNDFSAVTHVLLLLYRQQQRRQVPVILAAGHPGVDLLRYVLHIIQ